MTTTKSDSSKKSAKKAAATFTVTYEEGDAGSAEVDSKVLPKGVPVPGITANQLKRLEAIDGLKFSSTETKETS